MASITIPMGEKHWALEIPAVKRGIEELPPVGPISVTMKPDTGALQIVYNVADQAMPNFIILIQERSMAGLSKKEMKKHIDDLPDNDPRLLLAERALIGSRVPYIPKATLPEMGKPKEPPHRDGQPNPMYLVEQRDIYIRYAADWWNYYGTQWPDFRGNVRIVHEMAKQQGLDLETYAPESLSLTTIQTKHDIFEATDAELRELERRIEKSHEIGLQHLDHAKKKRWARVLRRCRKLRGWCRSPVGKNVLGKARRETWRSLHPLRYMLWTMRSSLLSRDGSEKVLEAPNHLIFSCMVIQLARMNHIDHRIDGVLVQMPPGHGKTNLAVADRALHISLHPEAPCGILHHSSERAKDRFDMVFDHFDEATPTGRRRRVLFPDVYRHPRSRTRRKLELVTDGRMACGYKEGNLSHYGVHTKAQGISFYELTIDDPSDEKEMDQAGTRDETNNAMARTWMPRLRGLHSFFVYVCTVWHPDDFASKLRKMSRSGDINLAFYGQACGGKDENFEPIWEEVCDRRKLQQAFIRLGEAGYACQYQNNAESPGSRRISRLHFYPESWWSTPGAAPPEWTEFFRSPATEYWISTDPAGTDKKTSNLAGAILYAFGNLRAKDRDSGSWSDEPKVVMLKMSSLRASQTALAQAIVTTVRDLRKSIWDREIDSILVETTGGYHATAEFLEDDRTEIPADKVIRKPPGVGTKLDKLMKYAAIHLEDGDVLFPGVEIVDERGEPSLQIAYGWEDMATQLLQAGSVRDDNLLDCVRQACQEHSAEIFRMRKDLVRRRRMPTREQERADQRREFFENKMKHLRKTPDRGRILSPMMLKQGIVS